MKIIITLVWKNKAWSELRTRAVAWLLASTLTTGLTESVILLQRLLSEEKGFPVRCLIKNRSRLKLEEKRQWPNMKQGKSLQVSRNYFRQLFRPVSLARSAMNAAK